MSARLCSSSTKHVHMHPPRALASPDWYLGRFATLDWRVTLLPDAPPAGRWRLRHDRGTATNLPPCRGILGQEQLDCLGDPGRKVLRRLTRTRADRRPVSHAHSRTSWERPVASPRHSCL